MANISGMADAMPIIYEASTLHARAKIRGKTKEGRARAIARIFRELRNHRLICEEKTYAGFNLPTRQSSKNSDRVSRSRVQIAR